MEYDNAQKSIGVNLLNATDEFNVINDLINEGDILSEEEWQFIEERIMYNEEEALYYEETGNIANAQIHQKIQQNLSYAINAV